MEKGKEQMLISGFSEESGVDSLPPRCYSYLQASCRVFVCVFRSPLRGRRDRRSGEIAKQETGAAGEFGEIREDNQRRNQREESDCAASGRDRSACGIHGDSRSAGYEPMFSSHPFRFVRLSEEKSEEERERGKI